MRRVVMGWGIVATLALSRLPSEAAIKGLLGPSQLLLPRLVLVALFSAIVWVVLAFDSLEVGSGLRAGVR